MGCILDEVSTPGHRCRLLPTKFRETTPREALHELATSNLCIFSQLVTEAVDRDGSDTSIEQYVVSSTAIFSPMYPLQI